MSTGIFIMEGERVAGLKNGEGLDEKHVSLMNSRRLLAQASELPTFKFTGIIGAARGRLGCLVGLCAVGTSSS